MVFNREVVDLDWIRKKCFYIVIDETLEQVSQRSCGCPIIERVQGQVGQGFEQPKMSLAEELELHDL